MEWKRMSKREALLRLRSYDRDNSVPSSVLESVPKEYKDVRNTLCEVRGSVEKRRQEAGVKMPRDYATDLFLGIALHKCLSRMDFGLWEAADDNVWRYIAVSVIPDIVHDRLGGEYAKDAFSGVRSSRFWVRNIWWYVHLSLVVDGNGRPDYLKTEQILSRNDTDILAGVVDHQGNGFRVELFRAMMRTFDDFCKNSRLSDTRENVFRYLIKEYQIRTAVVDPDLEGHRPFLDEIFVKGARLTKEQI